MIDPCSMPPLPRRLPRLCVHALLCTGSHFLAAFALKCASWSAINQGTSRRAACASLGLQGLPSVDSSNTMASRTLALELIDIVWGAQDPTNGSCSVETFIPIRGKHGFLGPQIWCQILGPNLGPNFGTRKNAPLKSSLGLLMS